MGSRIQLITDFAREIEDCTWSAGKRVNAGPWSSRWTRPVDVSLRVLLICFGLLCGGSGCHTPPRLGTIEGRRGDEIVAAGQFVHSGTPVVLWMDPGGYDAYRVERRFSPLEKSDWRTHKPKCAS